MFNISQRFRFLHRWQNFFSVMLQKFRCSLTIYRQKYSLANYEKNSFLTLLIQIFKLINSIIYKSDKISSYVNSKIKNEEIPFLKKRTSTVDLY